MKKPYAIKVLTRVKANWVRQPTDAFVQAEWAGALESVEVADAMEAVDTLRNSGREDSPTPGMVRLTAIEIGKRRDERERRDRKRLEEPPPSEEERQRVRRILHDFLAEKDDIGRTQETPMPIESKVPSCATESHADSKRTVDPETQRAQQIILNKRRRLKRRA